MDNEQIDIKEGYTMKYIIPGTFICIAGICISFLSTPLIGVPVGIPGVLFFAVRSGILIDLKEKRIKKYDALLLKKGEWKSLDNLQLVELQLSNHKLKLIHVAVPTLYMAFSNDLKGKSYDLILHFDGKKTFRVPQFHRLQSCLPDAKTHS